MHNLSLSDEQLQKMVALQDRFHIATAARGAEMMSLFHQIGARLAEGVINKNDVRELHAKVAKLHTELSDEHFRFMLENAEILTPEQRKQLHHNMLQHHVGPGHMPGMGPFMGPGMGHPMPPPMMPFGPMGRPFMAASMGHPPGMGWGGPGMMPPPPPPPPPNHGFDSPPDHPPPHPPSGGRK